MIASSNRRIFAVSWNKPTLSCASLRRCLSTTPESNADEEEDANHDDGFVKGRVKFFSREKYYGFCNPFDEPNLDVFIHRTDFVTDLPFDLNPKNPFLQQNERIRFKIDRNAGKTGEQPRAREITFVDGRPIPPLRKTFYSRKLSDMHRELGKNIHTIMTDDTTTTSSEDKWERVQGAWQIAELQLKGIHKTIERVGMRIEDFPVFEDPEKLSFAPPTNEDDM